ncbi:Caspase-1 [Halotydeus destructor]|nr:Caspase-1 [Halotydeus destructor]
MSSPNGVTEELKIDNVNGTATTDENENTQHDGLNCSKLIPDEATGGDTGDARGLGSFFSRREPSPVPNYPILRSAADSVDYAMDCVKRGICLIINNKTFDLRLHLGERKGTEIDGLALETCFANLNYEVVVLNNGTSDQIRDTLRRLRHQDHTHCDSLVVCILSHGERGQLWASDRKYVIDEVFSNFTADKCPSLAGKPKLFFIQACQGDKFDRGAILRNEDVADSATYFKIPSWADFLIAYSTVSGYYSWRNPTKGSWFVQALTKVFEKHADSMDLLSMLTLVNQEVAYSFESSADIAEYNGNKQVPCITSMLTRRVFFASKI